MRCILVLTPKKFEQEARNEAAKSKCSIRKVGAIIASPNGDIIGRGYNYSNTCECADYTEDCHSNVVHAEVVAIDSALAIINGMTSDERQECTIYVTQPPCNKCLAAIATIGLYDVKVCEEFIKFDDDKDDYSLIPIVWIAAFAKILTFGAKKYKPNNWKRGTEDRYYSALMRHLIAWRDGEWLDKDSGMPHLWHVLTNVGFLITLGGDKNGNNNALQQRDKE